LRFTFLKSCKLFSCNIALVLFITLFRLPKSRRTIRTKQLLSLFSICYTPQESGVRVIFQCVHAWQNTPYTAARLYLRRKSVAIYIAAAADIIRIFCSHKENFPLKSRDNIFFLNYFNNKNICLNKGWRSRLNSFW
jgi:hypothetical protein